MPISNVRVNKSLDAKPYRVGDKVRFESPVDGVLFAKSGTVSRDEDADGMVKVDVLLTTYIHKSRLAELPSWEEERNRV